MARFKLIIFFFSLLGTVLLASIVFAQKVMTVQVKEGQVRATPSHLGKIVARLAYGSTVNVTEDKGDWKKVSLMGGKQGWMHSSALTSQKLALKAGQARTGSSVSTSEVALAGKGFSKEVEAEYRQKNKNLDYTWIDRMEAFKTTPKQKEDFAKSGRLTTAAAGGGQ